MLKRIGHIILSVWLAVLLLFGGTAKEFVHLFASHEDTIHTCDNKGVLVIEPEHHHCTFLSFVLLPFVNDAQQINFAFTTVSFPQHKIAAISDLIPRKVVAAFLRGPPAAIV